jgi:hypothetical protein
MVKSTMGIAKIHLPRVELGSFAWKANIITVILQVLLIQYYVKM